jgi:VanZ family protein
VKHIKRLLEHKQLLLALAILWTLLMLFLCLDTTADLPVIKIKNIDKLAHFCFHFGFVWLWYFYFICNKNKQLFLKYAIISVLLSVSYGILIEFLQNQFTTTRKADIMDVAANILGALTSVFAANYFQRNINNINL